MSVYRFKTQCCPDRDGRQPLAGETKFTAHFTTDDGAELHVEMGEKARAAFVAMLGWQHIDDAREITRLRQQLLGIIRGIEINRPDIVRVLIAETKEILAEKTE